MVEFILNTILWTLAIYGFIEIIKNVLYIFTYTRLKSDGIYFIIAVRNQENKIEGFLRSVLFRFLYGNEENVKDVIEADLGSKDTTKEILEKMQKDYPDIKVTNWHECKEIIDNINQS
ncbi:MAG: glycosyltransferase [Clostridia bacterium]